MSFRYQAGFLTAAYIPLQTPDAPTVGTLSMSGVNTLALTFFPPDDVGGSAITGYTVVATDASSGASFFGSGASSPVSVGGLTVGRTYTAKVYAINAYGSGPFSGTSNIAGIADPGQAAFTTPGTYSWTAPAGVTSVCVVCIGGGGGGGNSSSGATGGAGGGLGWKNNITVVPGTSYTVEVGVAGARTTPVGATNSTNGGDSYFISTGTVAGFGGAKANTPGSSIRAVGGSYFGDGGGVGGYGGNNASNYAGGGGGAGGYSGNGGDGGIAASTPEGDGFAGSGGGGGGGGCAGPSDASGAGGGVGVLGEGTSGAGGAGSGANAQPGLGGSGGQNGSASPGSAAAPSTGGNYGGGGGSSDGVLNENGPGGIGAVRIIWGFDRAFPSTNTGDV